MAKLGNVCEIAAGQGAHQGENSYCNCNEGIPFIKAGDLSDLLSGKLETEIQCVNEIVAKQHKLKLYPAGSILFAKSGMSCMKGYVYRTKNPCYIVSHLAIVIPQGIDGEYLKYYFQHNKPNALIKDSADPSISLQDISNIEWTVPSLDIQASIASELNKVNMLISFRKQQLSKLDELVKSRFVELFGDPVFNPKSWETAPLSDLIVNANNGMARRGKDVDGNIVLRLVELQNGFIDYSAPNRICLNDIERKRYELVDNDFLFARVNGNPDYVGRCAVFRSIGEPVFHNDHIIRVHFDEAKINGCFMSVLLNSDYGKRQMREQIKTSAGQYTISQDGIGAIMAILPPLELQNQFAAFVEQTDKSKFEIQKSLEKLETLKKALMQKYFG